MDQDEQPNQRKTYFIINQGDDCYSTYFGDGQPNPRRGNPAVEGRWYFRFPEEFLNSTNRKWIEVQHVAVSFKDNNGVMRMTNDIVLHSTFIKRDAFLENTVMICNETRTKYKKYEYTSNDKFFEIWFTSFTSPNFQVKYDDTTFIIELMLIY